MTPHRCDQYLQHLALLLRLSDGDLASDVADRSREEIRRVLGLTQDVAPLGQVGLAEADE